MHRLLLHDLQDAVLSYYLAEQLTMPEPVLQMLPTVDDALKSRDARYVELVYALFSMAVESYVLWGRRKKEA
jgi:hypothetical protein